MTTYLKYEPNPYKSLGFNKLSTYFGHHFRKIRVEFHALSWLRFRSEWNASSLFPSATSLRFAADRGVREAGFARGLL